MGQTRRLFSGSLWLYLMVKYVTLKVNQQITCRVVTSEFGKTEKDNSKPAASRLIQHYSVTAEQLYVPPNSV